MGDGMVTTIIPTRDRANLLMGRAIPSVLAQTVDDWECIVVADGHDELTARQMRLLTARDPRFAYYELPRRELTGLARWAVGGTEGFNLGLSRASHRWISYLADDDAYRPEHHELLLAKATGADVVYGQSIRPDTFAVYGTAWPPQPFDIVQGSYIIRRSVVGRARTEPAGTSWDAWWWRDLLERGDIRFRKVEAIVHDYHPAPENLIYHGAQV